MRLNLLYTVCVLVLCLHGATPVQAQPVVPPTNSWQQAKENGEGTISVLWYDVEPFIYRSRGNIVGVEYELMEGFKVFLKETWGITLRIHWADAASFQAIYPHVKSSPEKGLFAVSFYSITDQRKKDVKFSPPYMPDLNVLVTNNGLPAYETQNAFVADLPKLQGYTMKRTTMEDDLVALKGSFFPALPVVNEADNYEVMKRIAGSQNSFGYVPVSLYVVALQRGIKVKRQRVLATVREGFAAIYTKGSDWDEPVAAYFNSPACKALVAGLLRKYLGAEVAGIIANVSAPDSAGGRATDIELLTKEREIVTQRLIDTALEAERTKTQRNIFLWAGGAVMLLAVVMFSKFKNESRLSNQLRQRAGVIADQQKELEVLNQRLNVKILQSKLNPHFLFNSLNAIQYHIGANDKKEALRYIVRFGAFLRSVLQSSDELLIPAETEAALANQYLWLEQNRFPDRFRYEVTVSPAAAEMATPPLLVHSVLQEALYVNILNSPPVDVCLLQVYFLREGDALLIRVCDNGLPATEAPRRGGEAPAAADNALPQRLEAINALALTPVEARYQRSNNENITELRIPQPLFHA